MKKLFFSILLIMLLSLTSCTKQSEDKQNNDNNNNNLNDDEIIYECGGAFSGFYFNSFSEAKQIYNQKISSDSRGDLILLDLDQYGFYTKGAISLFFAKKKENNDQLYSTDVSIEYVDYSVGMIYKNATNNDERVKSENKILIRGYNHINFELPSFNINEYDIKLRGSGEKYIKDGKEIVFSGIDEPSTDLLQYDNYYTDVPLCTGVYDLSYQGKVYCSFEFYCDEKSIEYVQELILNNIVIIHR